MNNIFELVYDMFLTVWGNINTLVSPIFNFVITAINWLVPLLLNIITWIIDGIQSIIKFFSDLFGIKTPSRPMPDLPLPGTWGGGGGSGRSLLMGAIEVVNLWTL